MSLLDKQRQAFAGHTLPTLTRDDDFTDVKKFLAGILPGAKVEVWHAQKMAPQDQLENVKTMIRRIREKLDSGKAINAFLVQFGVSGSAFVIPTHWDYIFAPEEATPNRIEAIRKKLYKEAVDYDD